MKEYRMNEAVKRILNYETGGVAIPGFKNFIDPIKIFFGIFQAIVLIYKLKPNAVFSKGGFVAFPVVVAAWLNRIPAIIHESDLTIGLTNKLCLPFAKKICVTFPPTVSQIKNKNKAVLTGIPIREDFLTGDANQGRRPCGFDNNKKHDTNKDFNIFEKEIKKYCKNLGIEL
jgi:UDP-N-acetylglucosamine--N-acetylmuramyl-(pentapeptide) pyrophosphoryl-undecaprenol N-acetylglucosamine transferase